MWRVGVDVGGTFTDLVALDSESGRLWRCKVPSSPRAPEEGVAAALDAFLETAEASDIGFVSHSTTLATNALLGQVGLELPRVALFVTEGFRDLMEIGRQNRSEVYNLNVTRPRPLVAREDCLAVRERVDVHGQTLVPLSSDEIARAVQELKRRPDVVSVAVSFLHAYANDAHERALGTALREAFTDLYVTLSSEVDPAYREFERTSTTVVNAVLLPLVRRYLEALSAALRERSVLQTLHVMQSSGGMATAQTAASRPATMIESGPASGVIATAFLARGLGIERALSFDMGGTTAKAGTVLAGVPQLAAEFEAAGRTHSGRSVRGSGYPVRVPFVDLAEVSAGGGTIAFADEAGVLRVGPLSAGADPGPAAYGKSDRPTVTDANVVLGRLDPRGLLGGTMPLDVARARTAVASLSARLHDLEVTDIAAGIVRLADDEMARVVRIVTMERGHDPRDFTLVAFGGGGALHACAVADELGITRIVVPLAPGLFSAFGLLAADLTTTVVRSIVARDGTVDPDAVEALFADAERHGRDALRQQGVTDDAMGSVREVDARYAGQSFELTITALSPFDDAAVETLMERFHRRHAEVYGFASLDESVEFVNIRSTAIGTLAKPPLTRANPQRRDSAAAPLLRRDVFFAGRGWVSTAVFEREALLPGDRCEGAALIQEYDSCTLVPPGWRARVDDFRNLVVTRA
ncbi:MAG: hydantoinase/oxoprolinase family protein [Candidatus Eremiobacteraeota bacterium]|nr:hydantoinase/oxoprolinase family protein [Candidatus Eremiobacteraeota bacterium]